MAAAHIVLSVAGSLLNDIAGLAPIPALGAACATLTAIYAIGLELKAQKQQVRFLNIAFIHAHARVTAGS